MALFAALAGMIPAGPVAHADWAPNCSGNAYVDEVQVQDFSEGHFEIQTWPTHLARATTFPDDTTDVTNEVWHAVQACVTGLYGGLADGIYEQVKCHVALQGVFSPISVGGETWDFEDWRPVVPWDVALNLSGNPLKACNWGGWPYAIVGQPYRPDTGPSTLAVEPPTGLGQLDPASATDPQAPTVDPQTQDPTPPAEVTTPTEPPAPPPAAAPVPPSAPPAHPVTAAPPATKTTQTQASHKPGPAHRPPQPKPSSPPPPPPPPPAPPPPPPPTVSVSWGARAPSSYCGGDTSCSFVVISWSNFGDGDHSVTPYFDGAGEWCAGASCSSSLTRSGSGGSVSGYWAAGYCGQSHTVTATVDGVESNQVSTVDHGC